MVEHSQPDGLVSRYEYDRYDTDGKVLKSSNNLGEKWTFDYRKDQTEPNTAFFWSGRTDGIGGQHIAADIAKSNGGTTSNRFEEQS